MLALRSLAVVLLLSVLVTVLFSGIVNVSGSAAHTVPATPPVVSITAVRAPSTAVFRATFVLPLPFWCPFAISDTAI